MNDAPDLTLTALYGNEQVYKDKLAGVPGLMRILWGLGEMDQSVRSSHRELAQKWEASRLTAIFRALEAERMEPAIAPLRGTRVPTFIRGATPGAESLFPTFPYSEQYAPSPRRVRDTDVPLGMDEGMVRIAEALRKTAAMMAQRDVEMAKEALGNPLPAIGKALGGAGKAISGVLSKAKPAVAGVLGKLRGASKVPTLHGVGAPAGVPKLTAGVKPAPTVMPPVATPQSVAGGTSFDKGNVINFPTPQAARAHMMRDLSGAQAPGVAAAKAPAAPTVAKPTTQGAPADSGVRTRPTVQAPAPTPAPATPAVTGVGPAAHIRPGKARGPEGTRVITKPVPQAAPATTGQTRQVAPKEAPTVQRPAAEATPQPAKAPPSAANAPATEAATTTMPKVAPPATPAGATTRGGTLESAGAARPAVAAPEEATKAMAAKVGPRPATEAVGEARPAEVPAAPQAPQLVPPTPAPQVAAPTPPPPPPPAPAPAPVAPSNFGPVPPEVQAGKTPLEAGTPVPPMGGEGGATRQVPIMRGMGYGRTGALPTMAPPTGGTTVIPAMSEGMTAGGTQVMPQHLMGAARAPKPPTPVSPVRASPRMADVQGPTGQAAPPGAVSGPTVQSPQGGGGAGGGKGGGSYRTPAEVPTDVELLPKSAPAVEKPKPLLSTKHKLMLGAGLALGAPLWLAGKTVDTAGRVLGSEGGGSVNYGVPGGAAPMSVNQYGQPMY